MGQAKDKNTFVFLPLGEAARFAEFPMVGRFRVVPFAVLRAAKVLPSDEGAACLVEVSPMGRLRLVDTPRGRRELLALGGPVIRVGEFVPLAMRERWFPYTLSSAERGAALAAE